MNSFRKVSETLFQISIKYKTLLQAVGAIAIPVLLTYLLVVSIKDGKRNKKKATLSNPCSANTSLSYLQLYMQSGNDLYAPKH